VRVDGAARETAAGLMSLSRLARVEVIIDPPLDPAQRRWRVVLDRETPRAAGTAPLAEGLAGPDGRWWKDGLEAGMYLLDVLDGGGTAFERTRIEVVPNGPPLRIAFAAIAIRGTVKIGDRPLRGELTFQPDTGGGAITLASDDEGEFSGTVPREGLWRVEVAPHGSKQRLDKKDVLIRARDGVARVDLTFPGGVVSGRVIDESGNPPARASIRLASKGSVTFSGTESDGTFELIGLNLGAATIEARYKYDSSGPVPLTIGEKPTDSVTLTMRRKREITGWIVSPSGQPVAGAVVHMVHITAIEEAVSGPGGDFSFYVPRGIDAINLAISAVGFPVKMTRIAMTAEMDVNPRFVLAPAGGMLIAAKMGTAPWPWIGYRDACMPLTTLLTKTLGTMSLNPRDRGGVEFLLEPGVYTLCPERVPSDRCIQENVQPGREWFVDVARLRETGEKPGGSP
jgi:hypothetical protein